MHLYVLELALLTVQTEVLLRRLMLRERERERERQREGEREEGKE